MPVPDDTCEFTPTSTPYNDDDATLYWLRDGRVMYRHYPIKGADPATFRFYRGSFGKDRKHAYCTSVRLAGSTGATFRALNFTYATDGRFVWTMGGKVKDADAALFVVCDDGVHVLKMAGKILRYPYGYAKDKDHVYYYDYDGTPNRVRKATPSSFRSLNDGVYATDGAFVFCRGAALPKAVAGEWRMIGRSYSTDGRRVYYDTRELPGADPASLVVMPSDRDWIMLARDNTRHYLNDRVIEAAEFAALVAENGPPADPATTARGGS